MSFLPRVLLSIWISTRLFRKLVRPSLVYSDELGNLTPNGDHHHILADVISVKPRIVVYDNGTENDDVLSIVSVLNLPVQPQCYIPLDLNTYVILSQTTIAYNIPFLVIYNSKCLSRFYQYSLCIFFLNYRFLSNFVFLVNPKFNKLNKKSRRRQIHFNETFYVMID